MFIGHFAAALGAKKMAPSVSLGALFLAGQLADLIWPNLVLLGIEWFAIDPGNTAVTPLDFAHYPYSHSLLTMAAWAALFAALYSVVFRANIKVGVTIAALVLSHWALDALTHRPDLPVMPGGTVLVGLGLWNLPVLAVITELLLFGAGIWLYTSCTKPADRRGSIGFWSLVGFLLLVYIASIVGPPPPSIDAVVWSAQATWLIVFWGYWIDRHRISAVER